MIRRATSTPPELPGYQYSRLLGSGGFSDVFLYDQRLPRRQVAVKVLLTEQLNATTRAQFVAEANVMAQLSTHPYIVTIHHADVAGDGRPYFVMEYCSGPSLAERYKRAVFGVEDALRIGVRLSSAIATAHSAGILHRDIKPGNVLTNAYGWPALTDFGISSTLEEELPVQTSSVSELRDAAAAGAPAATSGGPSVGLSVPWSPPEMFEDDPQPDVRSDVFALAATIHTLVAGRTPFEVSGRSNGTLDLIGRIERGVITPIGRDDVPRSLSVVLGKGMATRRSDRFASALDFARALQRVELELGYAPTSIEVPNLAVDPVHRDDELDSEDETRVRSVATIAVQEPAVDPSPAVESTRLRTPVSVEQTVLRPRRTAEPATPAAAVADDQQRRATGGGRRSGYILGGVIAAVVVASAVFAAVILPGLLQGAATEPTGNATGGGTIDVSSVPAPVLVSSQASADGTAVTFLWANPKPKPGDAYLWAPAELPDKNTRVDQPQAVVTGVVPGSRICINVAVLRDGKTSPNPLVACNP